MYRYIMTKTERTVEVITFTRFCPILSEVITVEWTLHDRELECEKRIIELDKKEAESK